MNNIIFDLDGTLVDTNDLHHDSFEWAIQQQIPSFVLTNQLRIELEGIPSLNKLEMLNTIGYKLDVIKAYNDKQIYTDNNLHMITWDAELPDIIREYSKKYTLAICSNARSKFVFTALQLMNLSCFDAVYTANVIPLAMRKPNPYQFVLAMSQLNMNPDTTIIFEDSVPGLKAANSSGAGIVIKVDNSADTKEKLIKLLDA
jgi:pyrophosphatase PpaX|tara:strand:+ start:84 stop:686 length:603 start_codon:yes stop_codon:yes gene_type:complete